MDSLFFEFKPLFKGWCYTKIISWLHFGSSVIIVTAQELIDVQMKIIVAWFYFFYFYFELKTDISMHMCFFPSTTQLCGYSIGGRICKTRYCLSNFGGLWRTAALSYARLHPRIPISAAASLFRGNWHARVQSWKLLNNSYVNSWIPNSKYFYFSVQIDPYPTEVEDNRPVALMD